MRRLVLALAALAAAACASAPLPAPLARDGWTPASAASRPVSLGLPGGAVLAPGVRFAGGVHVSPPPGSPIASLSDLKLTGDGGFVAVSDEGDLVRGRLVLDRGGRLTGVEDWSWRRLTLRDGRPIAEKADGDAEGLAFAPDGGLLVSFERNHRIWSYGPLDALRARPTPVRMPDVAFAENDGMEGLAAAPRFDGGGWRVAGESGGVWDCSPRRCEVVRPVSEPPLADRDYRITGMDLDPSGGGWFVVQRSYAPPVDARARIRRMAPDGALGPVLVELKLPGTTDNFEGIAAEARDGATRLYILSDDNANLLQRTLMLAFDL